MMVTKNILVDMIMKYINREIDLPYLVDWAEDRLCDADFEEKNFELLRDIISHVGLADVKEFGLSWDDCYDYLHRLGYNPKVMLIPA